MFELDFIEILTVYDVYLYFLSPFGGSFQILSKRPVTGTYRGTWGPLMYGLSGNTVYLHFSLTREGYRCCHLHVSVTSFQSLVGYIVLHKGYVVSVQNFMKGDNISILLLPYIQL